MAKFTVEEVSPIERRIKVEVEPERVQLEIDNSFKRLSKEVRIPGFRPGKAPRRILESRYKSQVESDVMQRLVAIGFREAISAHPEVLPVSQPRVINENFKAGEPFSFQVHVEVKPKLDPKDYEGLEIKKTPVQVPDTEVDGEIDRLRQAYAKLIPVEGRTVAQDGDFAVVNYEGTIDGKPFTGSKADQTVVEIAPGNITQGAVPVLSGANVGETREFEHTFAAGHRPAELAEKTAKFKITLTALQEKKLPDLDDAWAKSTTGSQTLQELKDRIRADFTERETQKAARDLRTQIVQQLIQRNPFEAPPAMISRRVDQLIEAALERFARQGIDPRHMKLDIDHIRASLRDSATTEVKGVLLLEAIADKEKIVTEPQDLDAKVQSLAKALHAPEEKVRAQLLSSDHSESVTFQIREEKTLAFLESKAKIQ